MNFQIDRNTLLRALERTRNAVITSREAYRQGGWLEVFKCYIFTADCDQLTIETSNSDIYMREAVSIGNPTADKKTFAVNAKQLVSAIKSLDSQSLEFDVLEYQVIVRHSIGNFALPLLEGIEDYNARRKPAINYDTAQHIEIEAPGLRSILNRLAFAMADDDLRPVMNGVVISMKKEHTDFVASDGHVLAKIRKQSITTEKPADVVLPRRIIGILQKVLPTTGFVEMDFNAFDVNWPADSKEPQPANFDDKLQHSIELLQKSEALALRYYDKGFYLAFSGGKDSQALYYVAKLAGVKFETHYSLTTLDPPELVHFIRREYPDVIVDRPKVTFAKLCLQKKALPTQLMRFCCQELKETKGANTVTLTGVRRQESVQRSHRNEAEIVTRRKDDMFSGSYEQFDQFTRSKEVEGVQCIRGNDKIVINPIIEWTENDVWYFLNEVVHAKHCVLYDRGWKRIGCLFCPMASQKEIVKQGGITRNTKP